MWEIESSKALLAKSTNADVNAFAQMMIDQHGKSTAKVTAAADEAKIAVMPPKLDSAQQATLNEIKAADAADIDAVYLGHQNPHMTQRSRSIRAMQRAATWRA